MECVSIPCEIIRGGTSKGVFILRKDLPEEPAKRDAEILSLFGSPDHRQIDGLGGGDPLTSKVVLVNASDHPDYDVEYESGEVGINDCKINYSTLCGNMAAAACLFALDRKLVNARSGATQIRILNRNTGKALTGTIATPDKTAEIVDCHDIDGVNGCGVEIDLAFVKPSGAITGKLLPTGSALNSVNISGREMPCSVVDCGTLYAFANYESFNLTGEEPLAYLDHNQELKASVEEFRKQVALLISNQLDREIQTKQLKVALIRPGNVITEPFDIKATVINKYNTHKAYPVSGALCLSAARAIPGSLAASDNPFETTVIRHPAGSLSTRAQFIPNGTSPDIHSISIKRSAHTLMAGTGFIGF